MGIGSLQKACLQEYTPNCTFLDILICYVTGCIVVQLASKLKSCGCAEI